MCAPRRSACAGIAAYSGTLASARSVSIRSRRSIERETAGGRLHTGLAGKRQHGPASDLDLAVLLINSLDNLEDPPDRLTSVDWFRLVTAQAGRGELTAGLGEGDLGGLRDLRDCLRAVFLADSADEAAALLNPALVRAGAVAQLVITPDGRRCRWRRASRAWPRWRPGCPRPWPATWPSAAWAA